MIQKLLMFHSSGAHNEVRAEHHCSALMWLCSSAVMAFLHSYVITC